MKYFRAIITTVIVLLATAGVITLAWQPAQALTYGSGAYGTCQFSTCSISLSSSETVSIDVTPSGAATSCTIQSSSVSVGTASSTGYSLSLAGASETTALIDGDESIPATSGTLDTPAALTANTWGYRIDDIGDFGSGPTEAAANQPIPELTFAGVPSSTSPDPIVTVTTTPATNPEVTTVWYGVCVNAETASGTYSSEVVYTAVLNN